MTIDGVSQTTGIERRIEVGPAEASNGKTKLPRLAPKDFPLAGATYRVLQRGGQPFFTPGRARE